MRGAVKAFSFRRRNISGSGSASVRLSPRWSGSWSPGASVAALRSISRGFRLSRSNHAGNTKAPQIALYSVLEGSDCKPPRIWSSCAPSPAVRSRHIGAARIPLIEKKQGLCGKTGGIGAHTHGAFFQNGGAAAFWGIFAEISPTGIEAAAPRSHKPLPRCEYGRGVSARCFVVMCEGSGLILSADRDRVSRSGVPFMFAPSARVILPPVKKKSQSSVSGS